MKQQVKINGISQMIDTKHLVQKELGVDESGVMQYGDVYKNYLDKMVDDKYVIDTTAEQENLDYELIKEASVAKEDALVSLFVEVNGVKYDAHPDAISNMNATVNTAERNLSKLRAKNSKLPILEQATESALYDLVYKTKIWWKGYDNKAHEVQVESIAEALELAINARGGIYNG